MKRFVLTAGLYLAFMSAAFAAPQSIGDCEKIADPDAYNRCLAAFGPAARQQKFTDVPNGAAASNAAPSVEPQVSKGRRGRGHYASRRGRGYGGSYRRHGRVRMEINVGGSRSSAKRGRGRRR